MLELALVRLPLTRGTKGDLLYIKASLPLKKYVTASQNLLLPIFYFYFFVLNPLNSIAF
jgi:hypothetical protein